MGNMFGGGARSTMIAAQTAQQGAQQQAAANRDAAIAGSEMSMVNQVTPNGTLTYSLSGLSPFGNPLYTATQTYDPVTQQTMDAQKRLDLTTTNFANSQANRAAATLNSNADFSEAAIKAKTDAMINPRLEQRFNKDEAALKQSLINRGMREGTAAFNDAMGSFNQGKNDAYSTEAINNRQQALQEIPLARNQILNEINALNGVQQISSPQFVSTPRTNVQPADYQQVASQTISAQNAAQQRRQAAMGGLFGLGGQLISAGSKFF